MSLAMRASCVTSLIALAAMLGAPAVAQTVATPPLSVPAADIATLPGLPPLGMWMFDKTGTIAHWLGERLDGKQLHEPINVILVDTVSKTPDEARQTLLAATAKAGYPARFGHSTGYHGMIGGALYGQLPRGRDDAFSDHVFEETNNHGRIFGPHAFDGAYVFIGAFSRESVNLFHIPGHRYASFNQARDDFARALATLTPFRQKSLAKLGNLLSDNPAATTGDHDGNAVVLRTSE